MYKGKALFYNIIQFGLSTFLPKAITFFMVPLYTYCMSTEEYGVVDLLNSTVQLLLPFVTLQVQDAVFRYSLDKECRPADVFTIGIRVLCIGTAVFSLLIIIARQAKLLELNSRYLLFLTFAVFSGGFRNISTYFCRGIEKIKCITISNVGTTIVIVMCNLWFLLLLNWGINGYLLAICAGNCFGGLWIFFHAQLYRYIKLRVEDKKLIRRIIVFSMPMIFSALSWWANTSLDKYILRYYCDNSSVGLLAVAYKIPAILSLFGTAISSAYSICAVKGFDKNDTDGFLGYSYHMISSCYVILCAVLILLNVFLAKLLFSNEFFSAWRYVPPLLFSALFSLISLSCEQFFIALQKTHLISITAILGALLNLGLNILLIPRFEAYGAAVSTCISFFGVWICRYILLRRYLHMKNSFSHECVSYFLLLLLVEFAYFGTRFLILQTLIVCGILLLNKNCILTLIRTVFSLRRITKH